MPRRRLRVHVRGVVQGVGFRPFVHRLAMRHALGGWVRNESGDVVMELDGDASSVDRFMASLESEAPPLARIDGLDTVPLASEQAEDFRILQSEIHEGERQPVPADVALCDACLRELHDPTNRRFEYPFITCTDCGPRYTVIESVPYDRERTTMRVFPQCPTCRTEYETPGARRYHSETNSCPDCGPRLWVHLAGTEPADHVPQATHGASPIDVVGSFLRCGAIVAIRGVGGFHLAVDAMNDAAVERLRVRKQRDAKPFAVMVRSVEDARTVAHVSKDEEAALVHRARPIVLLRRRHDARLALSVAPGLDTVGVMLAYTPLHHLLLDRVRRPLVMTSGNRSEEPIAASLDDAIGRLDHIADLFLLHNREIVSPVDDSVVRLAPDHERLILRRARGMAPLSIPLGASAPVPILAVGGQLKNTFTLAADDWAFVSPHLGDLDSPETLAHFHATLSRYQSLFVIEPRAIAHDLHPTYISTRVAAELGAGRDDVPLIGVQHHHAHIAAVLGEHGCHERVIGVAYDGTGYGDDDTVWGAELLLADRATYERVGHLRPAPLPGGDLAIRLPWRSALGYLSLDLAAAPAFENAWIGVDPQERAVAERQIARGINTPIASSMGRLFDAAAAVLGVCTHARYEGEAAMRLEALAGTQREPVLPCPITENELGRLVLDPLPLLSELGHRARAGRDVGELAAAFHETVAECTASAVESRAHAHQVRTVVLGGGVFQNARLLSSLRFRLEARGFRVLTPIDLPANDGAISYGQAVVAAARMAG